jgi:hypothetical protein
LAKRRSSSAVVENKSDVIRDIIKHQPQSTVKEIQAVLKERGVKASDALVNKVKYARKGPKGSAKRSGKQPGTSTSKAEAIRAAWGDLGLTARPRDVIATLKQRGVSVSSAQVSMLRKSLHGNGHATVSTVPFDHLVAAKHFAERIGGIEAARAALANLAKLVD